MKMNDVFPSKYLKVDDVSGNGEEFIIKEVTKVGFENQESGLTEVKPVIWFTNTDKGFICNKTNWKRLVKLFGDDSDGWTAKAVTLRLESVEAFGETVDSIRVKN